MLSHIAVRLVLLAAAGSLHAQQTWTVAAAGGAQFTEIAAAVAAAGDGDLIVVEPGAYGPVVIDGKGLTVVGRAGMNGIFVSNPGFPPFASPPAITIQNLTAQQHVHLSDMVVFNSTVPTADLLVRDCAGTVWLERLFCDSYGAPALVVERCADVVLAASFAQTNLMAATPGGTPVPGPGARFVDSRVHGYDSQFHGSHGVLQSTGFPAPTAAADGGPGIEVVGSVVTLQGCSARGNTGSVLQVGGCLFGGNGGDGVVLASSTLAVPELRFRACDFEPGFPAGFGVVTCGPTPVAGVALRAPSGQATPLPGAARSLVGGGEVVAPGTVATEVLGAPGDVAFLFASMPAPAVDVIGLSIHLGPSLIGLGFAVADATGRASLPIVLQGMPPGMAPFAGALQALAIDAGGDLYTTGPAGLIVR